MAIHRYLIRTRSAFATHLRGRTLWGHLCWAIRESRGEDALREFLDAHRGSIPPVALGDPMPAGWVHRPILAPMDARSRAAFASEQQGRDPLALSSKLKRLKRRTFLPLQTFQEIACTGLSEEKVTRALLDLEEDDATRPPEPFFQPHVSLDRASGHALKGQLFAEEVHFHQTPKGEGRAYEIWAHLQGFEPERLAGLLRMVGITGYGQNASTGRGQFEAEYLGPLEWPVADADAGMALGAFSPHADDPTEGAWNTRTHYGRVGNVYSAHQAHMDQGRATPFKKPQLLLTAGSVLHGPPRPVFGRLIEKVHRLPQVVDAGFAPVLPVRLAPQEERA